MWVDDALEDGYVAVEDGVGDRPLFVMSFPTYRALSFTPGGGQRLAETLWAARGTFLLPRAVIEPDAAADLQQGLSLVDPEPSDVCIYPPCGLPSEVVHEGGFPLCAGHAALMRDWDDLVSPPVLV